jgi:hypothetical protein
LPAAGLLKLVFDFSLRLLELHDRNTGTAWCDAYRNSLDLY